MKNKSIYDLTKTERRQRVRAAKKRLIKRGMKFVTVSVLLAKPNKKLVAAFKQFPHLLPKEKPA